VYAAKSCDRDNHENGIFNRNGNSMKKWESYGNKSWLLNWK